MSDKNLSDLEKNEKLIGIEDLLSKLTLKLECNIPTDENQSDLKT